MSEQEEAHEEEETEEEKEKLVEIRVDKINKPEKITGPKTPEQREIIYSKAFKSRVIELRARDDLTWAEIGAKLHEEFGITLSGSNLAAMFKSEMVKGLLYTPKASSAFEKYADSIGERYETVVDTMDWLMSQIYVVRDRIESQDITDIEKALAFLKMSPTIINIVREIKDQIKLVKEEQEKIQLNIQNNFYTPIQINEHVGILLTQFVKEGIIEIKDPAKFSKINKAYSRKDDVKGGQDGRRKHK